MWTTEQPPGQEARCAAAAILRAHFQACGDESMRLPPLGVYFSDGDVEEVRQTL